MATTAAAIREALPGLIALAAIAIAARVAADLTPYLNALALAIALGVGLGNVVGVPARLTSGIEWYKWFLEGGIVLLGASVPFDRVAGSGPVLVGLVVATVVGGVVVVETIARRGFSLSRESGTLLAAGASVCGVSAVVAVARSIDADRHTLAYVSGAVMVLDAITLVLVPVVGALLGLPDRVFGIWAGLLMFSTGPVTAAGFVYSPVAGQWATVTKLARNTMIGVLAVAYAMAHVRRTGEGSAVDLRAVAAGFPLFLVGFVAVMVVANVGLLPPQGIAAAGQLSGWSFTLAFAGIGLSIRAADIRSVGPAPLALLVVYLLIAGPVLLLAVTELV